MRGTSRAWIPARNIVFRIGAEPFLEGRSVTSVRVEGCAERRYRTSSAPSGAPPATGLGLCHSLRGERSEQSGCTFLRHPPAATDWPRDQREKRREESVACTPL